MPEYIDISDILKANPQICPDSLEESRQMLSKLRASGTRSSGYNLAPLFGGRRVSIQEDSSEDKRTVRLRSLSQKA
jgi:hypothetical protein